MGTIELDGGSCMIQLTDGPVPQAQSSTVFQDLVLGDPDSRFEGSCIDVVASMNNEVLWHLRASTRDGVHAYVHARSAVCTDSLLAVIVGSFVLGVDIPSGAVLWQHCSHAGAYFGLYLDEDRSSIIVHGELDILKLSLQGTVLWTTGGRDIFTGPFEIVADAIYATDFNGDIYCIDLQTGGNRIVGQGRPFPHA
jgi:outer membrane protein assembly factor BamB